MHLSAPQLKSVGSHLTPFCSLNITSYLGFGRSSAKENGGLGFGYDVQQNTDIPWVPDMENESSSSCFAEGEIEKCRCGVTEHFDCVSVRLQPVLGTETRTRKLLVVLRNKTDDIELIRKP